MLSGLKDVYILGPIDNIPFYDGQFRNVTEDWGRRDSVHSLSGLCLFHVCLLEVRSHYVSQAALSSTSFGFNHPNAGMSL